MRDFTDERLELAGAYDPTSLLTCNDGEWLAEIQRTASLHSEDFAAFATSLVARWNACADALAALEGRTKMFPANGAAANAAIRLLGKAVRGSS